MVSSPVNDEVSTLLRTLDASLKEGSFNVAAIAGRAAYSVGRNSRGEGVFLISSVGAARTIPIRLAGIEALFAVPCAVVEAGRASRTDTFTVITCRSLDGPVESYFCSIMGMLIEVLGERPRTMSVVEAVHQLIDLFQKLRAPPRKSIIGLIGELLVIAAARDIHTAVMAWRGDPDERYDFSVGNLRLEAKATSSRDRIHQMSMEQASPPVGTIGLLASMMVEKSSGGMTLLSLLTSIEARLPMPHTILRFWTIVADTLGEDLVGSLQWAFDFEQGVASARLFDLRVIPALRGDLPQGVSGVRFSTDLRHVRRVGAALLASVAAESRGLLPEEGISSRIS